MLSGVNRERRPARRRRREPGTGAKRRDRVRRVRRLYRQVPGNPLTPQNPPDRPAAHPPPAAGATGPSGASRTARTTPPRARSPRAKRRACGGRYCPPSARLDQYGSFTPPSKLSVEPVMYAASSDSR